MARTLLAALMTVGVIVTIGFLLARGSGGGQAQAVTLSMVSVSSEN